MIIITIILSIATYVISRYIIKTDKRCSFKYTLMVLFTCYLIAILNLTLIFKRNEVVGCNFIPFNDIYKILKHHTYGNIQYIVLNVILFIPYGTISPVLFTNKRNLVVLSGILMSFIIEIIQFITHRGILDINDFIYNSSGVLIGYCIYKLMFMLVKYRPKNGL